MKHLDPNTLPLEGKTLIEASAGTGKTYTIASLYLRYIVEQPFSFELGSDNLLVVTFTRAATAELRERIRQRLHLALECFRGKDPGSDTLIAYLLERYSEQKQQILKRLYAAEKTMDEAAVFTIHSFCHRALKQNEFASGFSSDLTLVEDDSEFVLQAAQDFWRKTLYPLERSEYEKVNAALKSRLGRLVQSSPEALMAQLRPFLSRKSLVVQPPALDLEPEEAIRKLLDDKQAAWLEFSAFYLQQSEAILQALQSIKGIRKATLAKHLEQLWQWLESGQFNTNVKKALAYVEGKCDCADMVADFVQAAQSFVKDDELKAQLYSQALHYIKARMQHEKNKHRVQSPDDFMTLLSEALNANEQGQSLSEQLRKQYPVAMIDEFQDTDPLQFGIFEQIYGPAQEFSWMMIGDPKQSIYAFRGGDIHTYVAAKQGTDEDKQFTLAKNYRSSQAMVESVNQLFAGCEKPAFLDASISFDAVDSQDKGSKGSLTINGKAQAAMNFLFGETGAVQCAEKICELLSLAQVGKAQLADDIVQAGDIAILVRDRFEARTVSQALRNKGVRSVYQSRESVYASTMAQELLRLVLAFSEPRNERLILAALAGTCCGLSGQALAELRANEQSWQEQQSRFEHYHAVWHKQGILTAIHLWMYDYKVPAVLLRDKLEGERNLADLIHLGELLQHLSQVLDGSYTLLRHFKELILEPDHNNKIQQRRLESDKNLVQIITVHGSKGLEYPIVFVPYALACRSAKDAIYVEAGLSQLDLFKDPANLEKADAERLAEELRLFYVAVTRAAHVCYLGMDRLSSSKGAQDALSYLLNVNVTVVEDEAFELEQSVENLVDLQSGQAALFSKSQIRACDAIYSEKSDAEQQSEEQSEEQSKQAYKARIFEGHIDRSWRLSSYSALAKLSGSHEFTPGVSDEAETSNEASSVVLPILSAEVALEGLGEELNEDIASEQEDFVANKFSFEKGAKAGNLLHDILEHQNFADSTKEQRAKIIEQRLLGSGFSDVELWQGVLEEWLSEILETPLALDAGNMCLSDLPKHQALAEMEFHLSIDKPLSACALNQLLAQYPLLSVQGIDLSFESFHGLLKGFIDLTFEHQGKFYICDYKSNHLGMSEEDYAQQAMHEAMAAHRYDAQLIIYTLALHRYLKQQISNYDYDLHIGGGVYLFLRGMSRNIAGSGVVFVKPEKALIEQLDLMLMPAQTNEQGDE